MLLTALKANASSLMIIHNHPSGNLTDSEADKQTTRKVKVAGRLLVTLLNSLIITTESYYSFADQGALYERLENNDYYMAMQTKTKEKKLRCAF